jgi:hypothetical protein
MTLVYTYSLASLYIRITSKNIRTRSRCCHVLSGRAGVGSGPAIHFEGNSKRYLQRLPIPQWTEPLRPTPAAAFTLMESRGRCKPSGMQLNKFMLTATEQRSVRAIMWHTAVILIGTNICLCPRSGVQLGKLQWQRESPPCMQPVVPLLCSRQPTIGRCPQPDKSNSLLHTAFPWGPF